MKRLLLFLALIVTTTAYAQKTEDTKLKRQLQELMKDFNGRAGIYVKNLRTGKTASINGDEMFPTASMIKVPIMCGVFDEIQKGNLTYQQELIYKDSLLYAGEDILGSFKDGEKIRLSKVQMLSITTSDNTASLWLQKLVGGENINNWLQENGFDSLRVNSRIPARRQNWKEYGWGQTTPREMASLLEKIRDGKVVSPAASERMYRNLIRIYHDGHALSQIPPYVQVASKQGAVDRARSEVVLVNAPHGDYVFCIATKNQKDTSWTSKNEGYQLITNVSALLWKYFEPRSSWKPADGIEQFQK
ncbi:MAG TPA: serine hydrolase [Sphingobacteriaceae bacterium]